MHYIQAAAIVELKQDWNTVNFKFTLVSSSCTQPTKPYFNSNMATPWTDVSEVR